MTLTRKKLVETIEAYDLEIARLQESKREAYRYYRAQLSHLKGKDEVKAEIEAFKLALKRWHAITKLGETVIEQKDALVDEILSELNGTRIATHVARRARANDAASTAGDTIEAAAARPEPGPFGRKNPAAMDFAATDSKANVSVDDGGGTVAVPTSQQELSDNSQDMATTYPGNGFAAETAAAQIASNSRYASRSGPIRPYCLTPECCASPGGRVHCYSCEAAHKAGGGAPSPRKTMDAAMASDSVGKVDGDG